MVLDRFDDYVVDTATAQHSEALQIRQQLALDLERGRDAPVVNLGRLGCRCQGWSWGGFGGYRRRLLCQSGGQ